MACPVRNGRWYAFACTIHELAARDDAAMASAFPDSAARSTWEQVVASCDDAERVLRVHLAARSPA